MGVGGILVMAWRLAYAGADTAAARGQALYAQSWCRLSMLCKPPMDDTLTKMTARVRMVGMLAPCSAFSSVVNITHPLPYANGRAEL